MGKQTKEPTVEELQKEIDRLMALNAALRGIGKVNRQAKNAVFLGLANNPEYRLQIYQALHPEDHGIAEEDLAVVTIENVLTVKPYNDLGMLVGGQGKRKLLVLCEAQSAWSVNVIFRLWQYAVDSLMNYFINNGIDLYGTPKLEMPDVEAYIVYTGKSVPRILSQGNLPLDGQGRCIISLNKEFFNGETGKPELTASVIYAKNSGGILGEYIRFSQIFDEQRRKHGDDPGTMAKEVFRICGEENILQEYLKMHRAEVEKIMLTMVSPEYIEKSAQRTAKIQGAIQIARRFGIPDEDIKADLVKNFGITPGYAQNCLDAEWEDEGALL